MFFQIFLSPNLVYFRCLSLCMYLYEYVFVCVWVSGSHSQCIQYKDEYYVRLMIVGHQNHKDRKNLQKNIFYLITKTWIMIMSKILIFTNNQ